MSKSRKKRRPPKRVLALPDLEHGCGRKRLCGVMISPRGERIKASWRNSDVLQRPCREAHCYA
jgi:hypothetical protein